MENLFNIHLDNTHEEINRSEDAYMFKYPRNIIFSSEVYNGDLLVWKGYLDVTESEKDLVEISRLLKSTLKIVNVEDDKVFSTINGNNFILYCYFNNTI